MFGASTSLSLTLWCEKRRLAGSRQRENKASTRAKDYPSILRSTSSSHLIVNRSLTHLSRALETKLKRTFPFLFPPFSYLLNFSLDRSTRDHRFDSITCCINRRNEASKVFEIESLFSLEARNKMLRVLPLNTWVVESVSFPTTRFVELYFREWEKVGCFDDYCVWKNRIEKLID